MSKTLEGRALNFRSYKTLGAHIKTEKRQKGVRFSVWAPNARVVSVVGDFNEWDGECHRMDFDLESGVWSLFIPGLEEGEKYKYRVVQSNGTEVCKTDPYGFYQELRPNTASIVYDLKKYKWNDANYRRGKRQSKLLNGPVNIYEVHLGSWKHKEDGSCLTYRELAEELVDYVFEMGYTHVEIMPLVEHPLDGSWGYQGTGYFSITSRYGTPTDFMHLVDRFHEKGIGVILDWVPGHFCKDSHGLAKFDGTCLYEYHDPIKAENHAWGTLNFNLERYEVIEFLISSAMFYLEVFHVDGMRVDAVSNMLYLDFAGKEYIPNKYGGRENLEAAEFLKLLNKEIFGSFKSALMVAEESTAYPLVTGPTHDGGLGFNYKWNMGWMNDMLKYMEIETLGRKWNHNLMTFSLMYAYSEKFILPLSHDEVVHGKKSLIDKMPGDYWQKFANLRLLYGYMMTHPGKKLLFMGGEFAQFIEWRFYEQLEWFLLEYEMHGSMQSYVKDLNHLYKAESALWELDHEYEGFEWIDADNKDQSIATFIRRGKLDKDVVVVVCNFTPHVYSDFRVGVPVGGTYIEIFNSDKEKYGGSGVVNGAAVESEKLQWNSREHSIAVKVPPLGVSYFKLESAKKR